METVAATSTAAPLAASPGAASVHRAPKMRGVMEDAITVVLPAVVAFTHASSHWMLLLAGAGLVVLAWNVITLHFPREVEVSADAIAFRAYGREHHYARATSTLVVRRFLVRDRVLVRAHDTATGRKGRYWLVASLSEFPELVASLHAIAQQAATRANDAAAADQPNVSAPSVAPTSAPPHTTA